MFSSSSKSPSLPLNVAKIGSHIHLMGICGTAMASLAGLLKSKGYIITGSDQNPYPPMSTQLTKLGIQIKEGYRKENLTPNPNLVIVGNVISRTHEEAQALLNSSIPYTSLPKAIGDIVIEDRISMVVAGTHGKTSTTSLLAWVAEVCNQHPGFLIGGVPRNFPYSFLAPPSNLFIIEGDEYDTAFFDKVPKFLHYHPSHVILTSVEFDHADIYKDLNDVKLAFSKLMKIIPKDGSLITWGEDANIQDVIKQSSTKNIKTYGLSKGDYQAHDIQINNDGCNFKIFYQQTLITNVFLPLSGKHNILNALSVFALTHSLEWPINQIIEAFKTFKGVKRRQEKIGEPRGIIVIEDFAHHPTAVQVTLEGLKAQYAQHRLFAVFEPRSATSRRKIFQKNYVEAFQFADEVVLATPFNQDAIDELERFSSEDLVNDLQKQGISAQTFKSTQEIITFLVQKTKPGDVIVLMSNGGFNGIYSQLLENLESHCY